MKELKTVDPKIHELILQEQTRQQETIRVIASENYTSAAVMQATGTVLSNKYSEGYAGKRYYEGQEVIDQIEKLAIERAKALFKVEHANVQPYSGSPANMAVYYALIEPYDPILGMDLYHGGHLTHGWKTSFSSRFYKSHRYTVDPKTKLIDYAAVRKIALEVKPKILITGASAYPRKIDFAAFAEIAKEVGAYLMADISHISGLVVGGVHPHPAPYADVITTTTHKTLRGPRGGVILCREELGTKIDRAVFPHLQGGPHNNTTAAIAVALQEASTPEFRDYAHRVVENAQALAEELLRAGFNLVSGGTDNHLLLIDLCQSEMTGKMLAKRLAEAGIITSCNTVPFDTRPPLNPSGVRLGTPAVTSRGFGVKEMKFIAAKVSEVAKNLDRDEVISRIRDEVREFCRDYPIPGLLLS